jgi:hypothetical protein
MGSIFSQTGYNDPSIRKDNAFARAEYLVAVHQHAGALAKAAANPAEIVRQRDLARAFEALSHAVRGVDTRDREGVAILSALEHYEYSLGKCEFKNILGIGRPDVEDCADYAFFMVDRRARVAMAGASRALEEARAKKKTDGAVAWPHL